VVVGRYEIAEWTARCAQQKRHVFNGMHEPLCLMPCTHMIEDVATGAALSLAAACARPSHFSHEGVRMRASDLAEQRRVRQCHSGYEDWRSTAAMLVSTGLYQPAVELGYA